MYSRALWTYLRTLEKDCSIDAPNTAIRKKWNAQPVLQTGDELMPLHGEAQLRIWYCPQPCRSISGRDGIQPCFVPDR